MIKELFDLEGKVAVVTGGARDFGYDMAEILAEAGAELVITSRTLKNAQASAAKLKEQFGKETLGVALDVCEYSQIAALAQTVLDWKGHVDILVNNAGGGMGLTPTNFFERHPEHIAKLIKVNLTGVLYCCKVFGKVMADQGRG